MIKGINRPDDALKAIEYGVDGIVVSNHGGRNMDSVVASMDVLPEIAEAVGERLTVILDSGVRRGSDIAKALALGAKAVLTGRATLYGTAVGGEAGAFKAINLIRNELDKTMAYTGLPFGRRGHYRHLLRRAAGEPAVRAGDGRGRVLMSRLDRCLNVWDLRAAAQRRLPKGVFEFVDRATEDHLAVANNRSAFERIKLRHRALVDVSRRSVATTLFGKPASLPMAIAPTGAAGLCWHQGELELAKAAAKAQIPLTLSTASMTPMEKIAAVGGRLWFQLYVWKQRELSHQLIERANRNGFEALIVTVDSPVGANREYNTHNGFGLPFNPTLRFTLDMMRHPAWTTGVLMKYFGSQGFPRHENYPKEYQGSILSGVGSRDAMRADSLAWEDIAKFRDIWPGVLMLKGVNRPDDAIKALGYGVDGIVVSNHGGRNMDSAAATLDVLPEIAEAVGDKMTLILDSGVRRGSDIVKALALGAKAVLTGRATLYGTAVGGEAGALKAINILKNEADKTMAYTGCRTVDEVSSDIFWGYREGNRMVGVA